LPSNEISQWRNCLTVNILKTNKAMGKVKITQVKSTIDRSKRQKGTMQALGLRKINHSVEHEATPQIMGMIAKVNHLIKLEQL